MWKGFTERARKVVSIAQDEAGRLGGNHVDTEHLLLGLVRENDSVAARILDSMGGSLDGLRTEIERQTIAGQVQVEISSSLEPPNTLKDDAPFSQSLSTHTDSPSWKRFTERAKRVVFNAQEVAARLGENDVSTGHLLLGMICDSDSVALRILSRLGVSVDKIRFETESHISRGDGPHGKDMRLTHRCKRVIDFACDEADRLSNNYIGTEHILLGLIREAEGQAGLVLSGLSVDLEQVRNEVRSMQESVARGSRQSRTVAHRRA